MRIKQDEIREAIEDILKKYNPNLKIVPDRDWPELKQNLSAHTELTISMPEKLDKTVLGRVGLNTSFKFTDPDIVIKALSDLCRYRDLLRKRGYELKYNYSLNSRGHLLSDKEKNFHTTNHFSYKYETEIIDKESVIKLISDFNLSD